MKGSVDTADETVSPPVPAKFDFVRWFALLSLLCIASITAASAYIQSRSLTDQILLRDATVTKDFIDSIVAAEDTSSYFLLHDKNRPNPQLESFFNHISNMPDVIGANVYDSKGRVLWSVYTAMEGRTYGENDELREALAGRLVYETGIVGTTGKDEQAVLSGTHTGERFVETYVPIWRPNQAAVVGAVEIYKVPRGLEQSLRDGLLPLWITSAAGGLLLFASLFWIVRRANRVMTGQHQRLTEMEALAMIGETAAAVTHSIRNPLASIRASAELALTDDIEGARESARDIIAEADRLNRWTRDLLVFSRADKFVQEPVDINECIGAVLAEHGQGVAGSKIDIQLRLRDGLPKVIGLKTSLKQIFASLIANAVTAMPDGGRLRIESAPGKSRGRVQVTISDSGPGLSPDLIQKALKPFYSTKPGGTGLGLPLSRQIMQRFGGELILSGGKPGLTVTLLFVAAR
jgi:two-component system, NtrC family, sensor histidine kinase HydH